MKLDLVLVPAVILITTSAAGACELKNAKDYFVSVAPQTCSTEAGVSEIFVERTEGRMPGNPNLVSRAFSLSCKNGNVYMGTLLSDSSSCAVLSASYRISEKL